MPKLTCLNCIVSGLLILFLASPLASAAVVFDFAPLEEPPFEVAGTWGVAADRDLNIYVADTNAHRIVKFNRTGRAIKAWGTEGSGKGQLYYPMAVAAGVNEASGEIRIFVADNGNHRIVTYNESGKVIWTFGSEGSANNQFLNPSGIAVLPNLAGGIQEVCVADTRNHRISCFTEQGQWLKSFTCDDCTNGQFVAPGGVFVRRLDGGAIHYYVSDGYPGRVVELNASGKHVQTIGGPGQSGELAFPDDLVVDKDGNIYVTESGFDRERVMKFGPDGKFIFSFRDSRYGPLISPHAIAIDSFGDLYVGRFGSPAVYKFGISAPFIESRPNHSVNLAIWAANKKVFLQSWYNGVEQACRVNMNVKITAAGMPWVMRTSRSITLDHREKAFSLPMTTRQAKLFGDAVKNNLNIKVVVRSDAICETDLTTFTSTQIFDL